MGADRRQDRRRESDYQTGEIVEKILKDLEEIKKSQIDITMTLFQNSVDMRTMTDRIATFERAFPNGPDMHRAAHEEMISASKAEIAFWQDLRHTIIKRGLLTALLICLGLMAIGLGIKTSNFMADIWTSIWQ